MVATVDISEQNGTSPGTTHDAVANINYGNNDQYEVVPASYPITVGNNSFEKYNRFHVSGMGGSNSIGNLQIWKSLGNYLTGEGIQTNLRTSGYVNTSYATPTITTYTNQTLPVSNPGSANLGIAGTLGGTLTAAGYSDYWKHQLQSTTSTTPGSANQKTFTIQYDEQ